MTFLTHTATAFVALALAAPALASPYTDAEAQLRTAYGSYRAALFLSNAGKAPETAAALDKFDQAWGTIAEQWTASAPPQYVEDAALGTTFETVNGLIDEAKAKVAEGALPEAHEVLEAVRAQIQALHDRNGIIGYSERMNAYHAAMETVLGTDYAAATNPAAQLAGDAALLAYLAADIEANPAPEAASAEYAPLLEGFQKSVAAFQAAAQSGDIDAAVKARDGLKVPYSKLFAKFG